MALGRVKWFNDARGFGFIETTDGRDIFVHYTAIASSYDSNSHKTLQPGQEVQFDVYETPKGISAHNVIQRDY